MTAEEIIAAIKRRRDAMRDASSQGDSTDAPVATAAQVAWEKADEYDSLPAEIENSK